MTIAPALIPASDHVMNLAQLVVQNARRLPDRVALVWGDKTWTWREFDARVAAFAAVLSKRGVAPGCSVLVHSKNSNWMLESMYATFRLGAIWVPTNFRLMPDEVVYMASVAQSSIFLCQTDFPDHAQAVCDAFPNTDLIWMQGSGQPGKDAPEVEALLQDNWGLTTPVARVRHHTPCWFLFTSGTTGKPKAAVLTHGQMAFVLNNHLADLIPGATSNDGALVLAPLSHGAGVHGLNVLARGAKTVLLPSEKLDVDTAFALIEQHRLTNLFTVPTILKMMVEHPSVRLRDHSSLRFVLYAGAPMYEEDKKLALKELGPVIVQYYGLGEVTGNITVFPAEEHRLDMGYPARPATCGYERTGMQACVQDEEGNEVPVGETGEICVVGPAVFVGYYKNDEANAKAFRNGWFRTGDIGHMDKDGYFYLTGRSSDMYISGGSNIYPREIEEKILTHDAISEVAVLGIADERWGEIGVAVCVLRPGARLTEVDLLDWMSSRIARYKLPKHVYFWDELPKSGYGKVPKRLVREELERRGAQADAGARPAQGVADASH